MEAITCPSHQNLGPYRPPHASGRGGCRPQCWAHRVGAAGCPAQAPPRPDQVTRRMGGEGLALAVVLWRQAVGAHLLKRKIPMKKHFIALQKKMVVQSHQVCRLYIWYPFHVAPYEPPFKCYRGHFTGQFSIIRKRASVGSQ
jgi:hypothetical protein